MRPRPWHLVPVMSLLLLPLLLSGAIGHANLVQSQPRPNSRLDEAPTSLSLSFSETLSQQYTDVQVVGPDGADHASEVAIADVGPRHITVTLGEMPNGTYTVKWRTLSEVDGHTRSGQYLLLIGDTSGDPPATGGNATANGQAPEDGPGVLEPVFRALGFAGASLALGIPLFLLLVRDLDLPQRSLLGLDALLLAGATTAALAAIGLLASLATSIGTGLGQALSTGPGEVLALRGGLFAAAATLFALATLRPRDETALALLSTGTLLAGGGLLATTLGGHAAASEHVALSVVNDWTHQVAVAFWIAGVVGLVVVARGQASEAVGARIVRRFSPAAVAAVAIIVATGTLATLDRIPSLEALYRTRYGWALLAKITLLAPLVALGAYHRYRVLPDLEEPGHRRRDFSRLGRSAGLEVALMAVVLIAAGLLTSLSPPPPGALGQAGGSDGAGFEPYHTFHGSDLEVAVYLKPQPVQVGLHEMFVNVTPTGEDPVAREDLTVFMTLAPPSDPHGESSPKQGHFFANQTWHFGGALFTEPGTWQVTLSIQGEAFLQETFEVEAAPASR